MQHQLLSLLSPSAFCMDGRSGRQRAKTLRLAGGGVISDLLVLVAHAPSGRPAVCVSLPPAGSGWRGLGGRVRWLAGKRQGGGGRQRPGRCKDWEGSRREGERGGGGGGGELG